MSKKSRLSKTKKNKKMNSKKKSLSNRFKIKKKIPMNLIGTKVALILLDIKNQIKIFHWQSKSYSEHKTLDKLFNILTERNDRWVETFMGKYGRIVLPHDTNLKLINKKKNISVHNYLQIVSHILLDIQIEHFHDNYNSDLSNIFDEIISDINRACYLLTLR